MRPPVSSPEKRQRDPTTTTHETMKPPTQRQDEIARRIEKVMPAYLAAHSGNSDRRFRKWKGIMRKLQAKWQAAARA